MEEEEEKVTRLTLVSMRRILTTCLPRDGREIRALADGRQQLLPLCVVASRLVRWFGLMVGVKLPRCEVLARPFHDCRLTMWKLTRPKMLGLDPDQPLLAGQALVELCRREEREQSLSRPESRPATQLGLFRASQSFDLQEAPILVLLSRRQPLPVMLVLVQNAMELIRHPPNLRQRKSSLVCRRRKCRDLLDPLSECHPFLPSKV